MRTLREFLADFLARDDGPTAVEYSVIMALVFVVCVVSISVWGSNSNKTYGKSYTKASTGWTTSS